MFSLDGKFFRTLIKIGDFLILGVLGIVFSLPIITMGASVTAMFCAGMKLAKDEESYVFRDFWRSFKRNFFQGFMIELILAVLAAIMIVDINICMQWGEKEGGMIPVLLIYVMIGMLLVLAGIAIYAFPLLAKFNNTVIGTVKNGLLLCMKHIPQTFVLLVCTVGGGYFTYCMPPLMIITIPFICYADSYIMARVLAPYAKQSEEALAKELAEEEAKELAAAEAAEAEEAAKLAKIMGRDTEEKSN